MREAPVVYPQAMGINPVDKRIKKEVVNAVNSPFYYY